MNRIIKFRAWHTELKRMFSAEELGKDEMTLAVDGRGFVNVSGASTKLSQYISEMIPMQLTGLKDAGGDDFYEGDIFEDDQHWYQIIWDDEGSWLAMGIRGNDDNMSLSEFGNSPDSWIQGNIYENPEWLI